jgi:hypothetical protein
MKDISLDLDSLAIFITNNQPLITSIDETIKMDFHKWAAGSVLPTNMRHLV